MSDFKENSSSAKSSRRGRGRSKPSKAELPSKECPDGIVFNVGAGVPPAMMHASNRDNVPYKVRQSIISQAFASSSITVPVSGGLSYTLSQLDQYTSFTAIFDQYRITKVEVWITPRCIPSANAPTQWASVIDYDDGNSLSTYAQALDYSNCVQAPIYDGHYRKFRPHVAVAAYSGAFTSFANQVSPWLDAASATVQHYGVKFVIEPTTTVINFDLVTRLTVQFRNVR